MKIGFQRFLVQIKFLLIVKVRAFPRREVFYLGNSHSLQCSYQDKKLVLKHSFFIWVRTLQLVRLPIEKFSVSDKIHEKMYIVRLRNMFAHLDITHQAHFTRSWKLWSLWHMSTNQKVWNTSDLWINTNFSDSSS